MLLFSVDILIICVRVLKEGNRKDATKCTESWCMRVRPALGRISPREHCASAAPGTHYRRITVSFVPCLLSFSYFLSLSLSFCVFLLLLGFALRIKRLFDTLQCYNVRICICKMGIYMYVFMRINTSRAKAEKRDSKLFRSSYAPSKTAKLQ